MADYIKLVKSLEELTAFKASNDFVTPNVKIKYFMAIVQNKIEDYKNTTQTEETEKEANIEIIEIPKVEFKNKTKKSIFDI